MANCTAELLAGDSKCLAASMSDHQLLAAIAYLSAVNAGESPTPQNLVTLGRCLVQGLSKSQLEAAIVALVCEAATPT